MKDSDHVAVAGVPAGHLGSGFSDGAARRVPGGPWLALRERGGGRIGLLGRKTRSFGLKHCLRRHLSTAAVRAVLAGIAMFHSLYAAEFRAAGDKFTLGGEPFQIRSGEIHYPRVPAAEWRDRVRMARAMGLNTISTYVFWNYHERNRGKYDFSGSKDFREFVRICDEEGMKVILRPGPYVCAEWDLGGLPAWLLAEDGIRLRSTDSRYLEPALGWMQTMGRMIEPLSCRNGGPVIMVQIENEFGSSGKNQKYLRALQGALSEGGYEGLLFTSDGVSTDALRNGGLPGMLKAVNFNGDASRAFRKLTSVQRDRPRFNAEFWVGWFDQWGRPHHRIGTQHRAKQLAWMMRNEASFNLYMFHGGTTRGLWNGANYDGEYRPTTGCYDYDAPLDEAGRPTSKFHVFQSVIDHYLEEENLSEIQVDREPPGSLGTFRFEEWASLTESLSLDSNATPPRMMEEIGGVTGFVNYRTHVQGPMEGVLELGSVKDRVVVLLDDEVVGTGGRSASGQGVSVAVPDGSHRLDLLVENMGRVNYGNMDSERKGIGEPLTLGPVALESFHQTLISSESPPEVEYDAIEKESRRAGVVLLRARFELDSAVDTWMDMRGFGRGVAWLNGRCLGRYWSVGPSQTLFIPNSWIDTDEANTLVVMELQNSDCPLHIPTIDQQIWATGL